MIQQFYPYLRWISAFFLTFWLTVHFPLSSFSYPSQVLNQLDLAQALIDQGNFNRAASLLESVQPRLNQSSLPYFKAITANLFLRQGNFNRAINTYAQLYQEKFGKNGSNYLALLDNYIQALLGRGKVYNSLASEDLERQQEFYEIVKQDRSLALELASEAVELSQNSPLLAQIRAKLNLAQLSSHSVDFTALTSQIKSLPTSRFQVEFLLDSAKLSNDSYPFLKKAIQVAQKSQDPLSLSWVWGAMGEYYEQQELYQKALKASHRATWAAQQANDLIKLIQWQWLSARVSEKLQQPSQANAAYRNAVSTVKTLRTDLAGSPVGQILFFDTIDPLLRDFLSFLLNQPLVSQKSLAETIDIIRLNQLAELDNFFGDICQIDFDSSTIQASEDVFIYTLLLPENSYEILKFADGSYQLVELGITSDSLKQIALDWRKNLTDAFYGDFRPGSQKLYETLIRPIKTELASRNVEHLIFVQDSLLRNIPMAGLYDNNSQQYLTENYLISYSLDLRGSLVTTQPKNALIVGSSEPTSTFPNALPGVLQETELIQKLLGGTRLINQSFTPKSLQTNLSQQDYEILHLASHSRFSGLSDEVKIQTGTEVLNLFEFDNLLSARKDSLKHLSLSACETASGSKYATLGVAGIGLRAGIPSVLGSLWLANDKNSVDFFLDFYQFWLKEQSVTKALKQAQQKQIDKNISPRHWANYILIS